MVQFEALWALTNIAAGTERHTEAIVKSGVVPPVINIIIKSPHSNIQQQALWVLANIIGMYFRFLGFPIDFKFVDVSRANIILNENRCPLVSS